MSYFILVMIAVKPFRKILTNQSYLMTDTKKCSLIKRSVTDLILQNYDSFSFSTKL